MRNALQKSPTGNFTFHAGPHTLIGLSGEKGRKLFFGSRDLNLSQGYAVLFGQSPQPKARGEDVGVEAETGSQFFARRLTALLKTPVMEQRLPTLLSDADAAMNEIKTDYPSGVMDVFDAFYRVVFRLTIRIVGASEIANDRRLRDLVLYYFNMIEDSATAFSVIFPRIPTLAHLKRTYAGAKLYFTVKDIIKRRKMKEQEMNKEQKLDDPLRFLLDNGDTDFQVIDFMIRALFAGLVNSGINVAWVLVYLSTNTEWRGRVFEEIKTVASRYNKNSTLPLHAQLANIPIAAWENEMPSIDACLRDSIRLHLVGAAMRKNTSGKFIPTGHGDEVIPPDAFVTYPIADLHLNPEIYENPDEWNPSRYSESKKWGGEHSLNYVGWGAGRHPCLGMRFAKLEQCIITAYFMATYDFELLNKKGEIMTKPPPVNVNNNSASPPDEKVFFRFKAKDT